MYRVKCDNFVQAVYPYSGMCMIDLMPCSFECAKKEVYENVPDCREV